MATMINKNRWGIGRIVGHVLLWSCIGLCKHHKLAVMFICILVACTITGRVLVRTFINCHTIGRMTVYDQELRCTKLDWSYAWS